MSMEDWSDSRLVRHAQRRCEARSVFTVFYVRYYAWIRRKACTLVNEIDAQDITNDAFVYLWRKLPILKAPYCVRAILRKTVRHKALDFIRHEQHCALWKPVSGGVKLGQS